jgi:hypothetical protein
MAAGVPQQYAGQYAIHESTQQLFHAPDEPAQQQLLAHEQQQLSAQQFLAHEHEPAQQLFHASHEQQHAHEPHGHEHAVPYAAILRRPLTVIYL